MTTITIIVVAAGMGVIVVAPKPKVTADVERKDSTHIPLITGATCNNLQCVVDHVLRARLVQFGYCKKCGCLDPAVKCKGRCGAHFVFKGAPTAHVYVF